MIFKIFSYTRSRYVYKPLGPAVALHTDSHIFTYLVMTLGWLLLFGALCCQQLVGMDVPDVCAHWLAALSQTLRGSVLLVAWETQTRLMKSQRCTDLPSTPWKILPLLRPPLSWAGVYLCWCPPMCIQYTVCLSFIPYALYVLQELWSFQSLECSDRK